MPSPLRRLATVRAPAVLDPAALRPGDPPPTAGRLLVLYDGGCGICLHGRDLIARLDRRGRIADDRIERHAAGLLADLPAAERDGSWHVIHPDGRREAGGAAATAALAALPGGRRPAALLRHFSGPTDQAYRAFVRHRSAISHALGLTMHPQKRVVTLNRSQPALDPTDTPDGR